MWKVKDKSSFKNEITKLGIFINIYINKVKKYFQDIKNFSYYNFRRRLSNL